jgi:hypothetical protein
MRTVRVAVVGASLFTAPGAIGTLTAPPDKPVWTEFTWPFPVDQWGIGRAFVCEPQACGVEVNVYVRPKIGFCKCATGVDDDDELDRVGDSALIGGNTVPVGAGRTIEVAWMKGRSRSYQVTNPSQGRVLSIGFNDRCDVMVALVTLGTGDQGVLEPAVLALLGSERMTRWIKWLLIV